MGTIIKDADKDDDSVALPESLPCVGHSLSVTQLPAQSGLGGHHVLTGGQSGEPSLWLLCAAPSPGLLGPCRGQWGCQGGGWAAADQKGERGERTRPPAFPPLSSPSPVLDPGDPQLQGRWEAGGRGSPAQG